MKKTYQSPVCQMILVEDLDILTLSITAKSESEGGYDNGAVITW